MKPSELLQKALESYYKPDSDEDYVFACVRMKHILMAEAMATSYYDAGFNPVFLSAREILYRFRATPSEDVDGCFFHCTEERLEGLEKAIESALDMEAKDETLCLAGAIAESEGN